jgi:hypothetical protein
MSAALPDIQAHDADAFRELMSKVLAGLELVEVAA